MQERTRPPRSVRLTQHGVGTDAESDCADPARREHLLPYAFGSCDGEPGAKFEEHLLDCDCCYEDLAAIERTRELIERFILSEPPLLARSRARRSWRRTLLVLLGAGALVLALAVGYVVGASV